jgi:hypothetical protein
MNEIRKLKGLFLLIDQLLNLHTFETKKVYSGLK